MKGWHKGLRPGKYKLNTMDFITLGLAKINYRQIALLFRLMGNPYRQKLVILMLLHVRVCIDEQAIHFSSGEGFRQKHNIQHSK